MLLALSGYVREPVGLNFPGFVYILGKEYSGREVLQAWKLTPLLKWGKENRGSSTASRSW